MRVIIGGDFSPTYRLASLINSEEYNIAFKEISDVFKMSDLNILNFESTIPLPGLKPIDKIGVRLSTTDKTINVLKYLNIGVVTLANNHTYDYGEEGLFHTLDLLSNSDIKAVGAGRNLADAAKVLFHKVNNTTIAIINCCEHEYGIAKPDSSGTNPLNPIAQYYSIKEAREVADYVIVIVHGGHEHFQLPSLRMQDTYRYFIDVGADVVVNHHQHCYSGYEIYKGKYIFYGLGNFAFDLKEKARSSWHEGCLLSLDLDNNTISHLLIPYVQFAETPEVRILEDRTKFDKNIDALNATISNREDLARHINDYYRSCERGIYTKFQPWPDRIFKGLFFRGLLPSLISKQSLAWIQNCVECQSNNDKLTFFLDRNARSTK